MPTPPVTPAAPLTLIGRPGCHLCQDALPVLQQVGAEYGLAVEEVSVLDHPDLLAAYAEMIPVILIDGAVHDYWRVDPTRLRRALGARRP